MMRGSPKKTVPESTPAYNELMGFEVFRPNRLQDKSSVIGLHITANIIRLTRAAAEALGGPDAILIFFDETGQRMMFQPADAEMENAVILRKKSEKKDALPRLIQRPLVVRRIAQISGTDIKSGKFWLPAHTADTVMPSLIFDLKDLEERRTR